MNPKLQDPSKTLETTVSTSRDTNIKQTKAWRVKTGPCGCHHGLNTFTASTAGSSLDRVQYLAHI